LSGQGPFLQDHDNKTTAKSSTLFLNISSSSRFTIEFTTHVKTRRDFKQYCQEVKGTFVHSDLIRFFGIAPFGSPEKQTASVAV
jgi:hypothetical protein